MMRFRNVIKEKMRESSRKARTWHAWFAWHPVKVYVAVSRGEEYVWLETIERRRETGWGSRREGYWAYDIPKK